MKLVILLINVGVLINCNTLAQIINDATNTEIVNFGNDDVHGIFQIGCPMGPRQVYDTCVETDMPHRRFMGSMIDQIKDIWHHGIYRETQTQSTPTATSKAPIKAPTKASTKAPT